ncbi:hypothetical protein [Lacipirellula parvula]|uniref:Uncharacterized protein n=1 Tax=Lacipirellula parvula TaxID=2650471 RepID=A0A5K7XF97_9BACT|nr:hypothetical protein [Lacipirellula parvula]BBO32913.1 hypothetical protein PLANPX_2525 [Lacipirellula parvula]
MDGRLILSGMPLATAAIGLWLAGRFRGRQRKATKEEKTLAAVVLAWSALPLLIYCGLYWLSIEGG